MLRVVCCYCKKQVKTKPSDTDAISHGVCDQCLPLMVRELGQPMSEFLDELRPPVLVVQDNARVIAANAAARKMLTREQLEICGELAGDVIGCRHAREPGGCGQTIHCKSCAIRQCVTHTMDTGRALPQDGLCGHRPRQRRQAGSLPDRDGEGELLRAPDDVRCPGSSRKGTRDQGVGTRAEETIIKKDRGTGFLDPFSFLLSCLVPTPYTLVPISPLRFSRNPPPCGRASPRPRAARGG